MRFCTECGTSLDQEASKELFCFNCGERLSFDDDVASAQEVPVQKIATPPPAPKIPPMPPRPSSSNKNVPTPPRIPSLPPLPGKSQAINSNSNDIESKNLNDKRLDTFQFGFSSYGIILTDTRKIAKLCRTTSFEILNIIKDYTVKLSRFGHQYMIFDYDSTRYQNNSWENYVDELSKFYYDQLNNKKFEPQYLFIIGGDEVIPMPVFDDQHDLTSRFVRNPNFESDIPYSYLISYGIEDMIWDGSLYENDPILHVGRLPFAVDFEKSFLTSYLDKVINAVENDFTISNCFSLSDSEWNGASKAVFNNVGVNNKFIDFSPSVTLNNVDNIFDPTSDILYFNLHGDNRVENKHFFGGGGQIPAISLPQISSLQNYNIIVTEACYGARFIGYQMNQSMLLNALNNNTLAYVGSSKIAWGSCTNSLSCADIVAKSIFRALSNGQTIGSALTQAKIDNLVKEEQSYNDNEYAYHYDDDDEEDDGDNFYSWFTFYEEVYNKNTLATSIEFNLFGEPTLCAFNNRNKVRTKEKVSKASKIPQKSITKDLFNKNKEQSILEAVRASVDLEFEKISRTIQAELYNKYQLTSDELQSIDLHKSSSSSKEAYMYIYNKKVENMDSEKQYYVICSKKGSIKKVITTK
jgi:hypothetical protein